MQESPRRGTEKRIIIGGQKLKTPRRLSKLSRRDQISAMIAFPETEELHTS